MAARRRRSSPARRRSKIAALEPVGNYAVRILFDDGHDSGLFSWDYLHELGRDHAKKWAAYRAALGPRAKVLSIRAAADS